MTLEQRDGTWALFVGETLHALVGPTVVIGRGSDCDVVLDYPSISRRHALVRLGPGGLRIEDLGSRHGTSVNERPVTDATPVAHGDRIGMGGVTVLVRDLARPSASGLPTAQIRRAKTPVAHTRDREDITQEHQLEPRDTTGKPRG